MQDGSNPKQLIAEKLKQSANILVTVSANPSVDSLTAALGLTLMLNKLDKHATAVFSGVIPPAINFLEPGKTFENNVDSLRDFIIALDKEKADRLRYKVEDDVVRIFITPYRTKISEKDLQFSQGDFNVDLIVALGVEDQKDLDQAITAHGRILHDATVVTINATAQKSTLGSIDWQNGNASSLSEMLASLADLLKPGLLDQQISTALLTGIVASTERFSNQHTTPQVMTIAAQLMAAGANQQLIATKLQTIPAPVSPRREKQNNKPQNQPKQQEEPKASPDGEMHIQHGKSEEPAPITEESQQKTEPAPEPQPEAEPESAPEPEAPEELAIAPPPAQNFNDLKEAIEEETVRNKPQREMLEEPPTPGSHNINENKPQEPPRPEEEDESYLSSHPSWQGREIKPPTMGGTLNATAEQALEDKEREEEDEKRNHKILSHNGNGAAGNNGGNSKGPRQKQKKQRDQKQEPKPPVETPVAPTPPPAPAAPEPVAEMPAPSQPEPATPALPPLEQPAQPQITPMPEPAPQPEVAPQPEIPVAAPPLVVSEPLSTPAPSEAPEVTTPAPAPQTTPPAPAPMNDMPTLEELEREAATHAAQSPAPQTLSDLEAERAQVQPAIGQPTTPPAPAPGPAAPQQPPAIPGLPPMPPMPDFSTLPPLPGNPQAQPNTAMPAMPEANPAPAAPVEQPTPELPQLPQSPPADEPPHIMPQAPQQPQSPPSSPPPQAPADPAQFRIPGAGGQ